MGCNGLFYDVIYGDDVVVGLLNWMWTAESRTFDGYSVTWSYVGVDRGNARNSVSLTAEALIRNARKESIWCHFRQLTEFQYWLFVVQSTGRIWDNHRSGSFLSDNFDVGKTFMGGDETTFEDSSFYSARSSCKLDKLQFCCFVDRFLKIALICKAKNSNSTERMLNVVELRKRSAFMTVYVPIVVLKSGWPSKLVRQLTWV